jgi:Domain of unknown function (DUF4365)/HNH endonuclease
MVHENPGRIAQRESVPFTRERSKVRSLVRPPELPISRGNRGRDPHVCSPFTRAQLTMASPPHGLLPERHATHRLEALSRQRFRALFSDPWFLVRDEDAPDYGADLSIEALIAEGRNPTNIRSFIQLKATAKPSNSRGEYKINVKISNIHYMVNSHSSFYCLYAAGADRLYYRSSMSVLEELQQYGKIPGHKRFFSITFSEELESQSVSKIHAQMLSFAESVKAMEQFWANEEYGELTFGKYLLPPEPDQIGSAYAYRVDEFGNQIKLEHALWLRAMGEIPRGHEVFHKNGNALDNRRHNLGLRPIDPRRFTLGVFPTREENTAARNVFRVILNGEAATLEEVEPPEPILFWKVIRLLQEQGMSMSREDVDAYKMDSQKLLLIEF